MLHLTDRFPEAGWGLPVGDGARGRFVSWMTWYAGVVEPVLVLHAAGLSHPYVEGSPRGLPEVWARIDAALAEGPWLMGERMTAADLLLASPFHWFEGLDPGTERARDWVRRCGEAPGSERAVALDAEMMRRLAA